MPRSPQRPCTYPGCGVLTDTGRCSSHPKRTNWQPDSIRGSSTKRGYGAKWRKIRAEILRRDSNHCIPCKLAGRVTTATQVDHIVPKAKGGTDEAINLQSICTKCHARKTAQDSQ
ncbi:MAG: HNH endonuclease [Candidatus Thiodiazotropha lotti]|nr:HNH endonuclease [Candidatus Thiodiazotropha lotti]